MYCVCKSSQVKAKPSQTKSSLLFYPLGVVFVCFCSCFLLIKKPLFPAPEPSPHLLNPKLWEGHWTISTNDLYGQISAWCFWEMQHGWFNKCVIMSCLPLLVRLRVCVALFLCAIDRALTFKCHSLDISCLNCLDMYNNQCDKYIV